MGSQRLAVLSLFLVLVGATMAARPLPETHPISDYNNEQVQFLGKFAVEQYNKKGKPHLFFIQVINGTVLSLPLGYQKIWNLEVKAKNCSEPAGPPAMYSAQVFENMYGSQIKAYGSDFMTYGTIYKL